MIPAEPSLWSLLREDFQVHGRDISRPDFQAIAVYRFGVARMRVKSLLLRAPLSVVYRAMFRAVRNLYGIEILYTAQIGRRVVFEQQKDKMDRHGVLRKDRPIHGVGIWSASTQVRRDSCSVM